MRSRPDEERWSPDNTLSKNCPIWSQIASRCSQEGTDCVPEPADALEGDRKVGSRAGVAGASCPSPKRPSGYPGLPEETDSEDRAARATLSAFLSSRVTCSRRALSPDERSSTSSVRSATSVSSRWTRSCIKGSCTEDPLASTAAPPQSSAEKKEPRSTAASQPPRRRRTRGCPLPGQQRRRTNPKSQPSRRRLRSQLAPAPAQADQGQKVLQASASEEPPAMLEEIDLMNH